MEVQYLKKKKYFLAKAVWKYKNVSDSFKLKLRLQKKFVSDISSLFEKSSFSDLALECPQGIVYCHKVIVSCRSPCFWYLLSQINNIQKSCSSQYPETLTIYLPDIQFLILQKFIRSLYTNSIDELACSLLNKSLEEYLVSLHHHQEFLRRKEQRLFLEKLDEEEERAVQQLIYEQICKGEISSQRGNLKDISYCLQKKQKLLIKRKKKSQSKISSVTPFAINTPVLRDISLDSPCCSQACVYSFQDDQSNLYLKKPDSFDSIPHQPIPQASSSLDDSWMYEPEQWALSHVEHSRGAKYLSSAPDSSSDDTPITSIPAQHRQLINVDMNGKNPCHNLITSSVSSAVACQQKDVSQLSEDIITSSQNVIMAASFGNNQSSDTTSSNSMKESCVIEEKSFDPEREQNLYETSSLEVEPSSSYDDQSMTPDSMKSDQNSVGKVIKENTKDHEGDSITENIVTPNQPVNPHKPLVRTRTFEVIQPLCSGVTENTEPTEVSSTKDDTSSENSFNDPQSDAILGQDIQPESVINKQNYLVHKEKINGDNADTLNKRELERKKGSLIFEHNFQTFSNIPTTNMMMTTSGLVNMSMSSESSMGLNSLYASMVNSMHSLSGADQAILEQFSQSSGALPNLGNTKEADSKILETAHTYKPTTDVDMLKHVPESRTPSPDSLSIDEFKNANVELMKEKSYSKEDLDIEIKEKDDKEFSSEVLLAKEETDYFASSLSAKQSENIPIVSGIQHKMEDSRPSQPQRQTSIGSVKDVDSIPLVTGYVDLEEPFDKKKEEKINIQDESKSQSMFSMFIDFNEISSPEEKKPKENARDKDGAKQPSGGMFMFIEADTLSPKIKRRTRVDCEGNKVVPLSSSTPKNSNPDQKLKPLPAKKQDEMAYAKDQSKPNEDKTSSVDKKTENEKKGFFVFIEAEHSSPKLKKRPILHRKPKAGANVMSKSAPSDSILFKSEESSSKIPLQEPTNKFMTKSVIDRDEFMSQPPARRNVSLNDKINESSKIPRPVPNFKEKLSLSKDSKSPETKKVKELKPFALKPKRISTEEHNGNIKSLEASISDIDPSLNVSLSEAQANLSVDFGELSETSDVSSLLSSLERSNDPSDQEGKAIQTSLGDDLLKMLIDEINTDVVIQIGEKKIKAHKCILASRCIYFAAMLSGHYVESAGNVIKLQGFSYDSVMMALRHIYSGTSSIPDGAKVGELAALADMLALDGLKDVVAVYLKSKLCHSFHKPCAECLNGVLDVMPLAAAYSLDELYHKCLKWAAKYFILVFPTRNFASLPPELQDRCLKQLMDDMSVSNIIETALGCEKVLSLLPVVRWAQSLLDLTTQLLESCSNFIAAHMSAVLSSEKFLSIGHETGMSFDSLEELLKVSCDLIRPDQAVLSHIHLTDLIESKKDDLKFTEPYLEMLNRILNQVEKFIIHNANRVAVCRKWPLLTPETQKRIKDAALVVMEFSKPTHSKSKSTSSCRVRPRGASIEPMPRARACSMNEQRLSRSASTTAVPPKNNSVKKLQPVNGRCHTPPPSTMKTSLQTPPPTRASTLRAQARQAAIQRSQSARTVAERPKSVRSGKYDGSREDISNQVNQNTSSSSQSHSGFPRGSTFTRSLSRPEQGHRRSITPIQHGSAPIQPGNSSLHVTTAIGSRPNTPGIADRIGHKRNASGPPLTTLKGSTSEDEGSRKGSISHKTKPISNTTRSPMTSKVPRVHLLDFPSSSGEFDDSPETQNRHRKYSDASRRINLPTTRVPLKENYPRINNTFHTHTSTSSEAANGHSEVRSRTSSIGSKRDTMNEPSVPPPGLGSRSNTFSKDEMENKGQFVK